MHLDENQLIAENLRLVHYLARRFKSARLEYDDLVQEGLIGLVKAARTYDSGNEAGANFCTYASKCIKTSMGHAADAAGLVRTPNYLADVRTAMGHARQRLTQAGNNGPTAAELAEESGETLKRVQYVLETPVVIPLDYRSDLDDEAGYDRRMDKHLCVMPPADPDDETEPVWTDLGLPLAMLEPFERLCLVAWLGLGGDPRMKVRDIAKRAGKSRFKVQGAICRALGKFAAQVDPDAPVRNLTDWRRKLAGWNKTAKPRLAS